MTAEYLFLYNKTVRKKERREDKAKVCTYAEKQAHLSDVSGAFTETGAGLRKDTVRKGF